MTVSATDAQAAKAARFHALHSRPFLIPNPWDVGTARLLEQMGFLALASTSAGHAFSRGTADNGLNREMVLQHLAEMADATSLPVSADLENGFGHDPDVVAETITLAARAGVVGGSIEDSTNDAGDAQYEVAHAAERIRAAVEAARKLPFHFTVTARAENFAVGRPDLADTIARLQRYQEAGADVLFAPGLKERSDIATLVRSVDRPVNVIIGSPGMELSVRELFELGVTRVSVGSSLARAAFGALLGAARELQAHGTCGYASLGASSAYLNGAFKEKGGDAAG